MSAVTTSFEAKIYISDTVPATSVDTLGEFAALSYTQIRPVKSIGRFGGKSNIINFAALDDTAMTKSKGIRDNGNLAVVCAYSATDAGQVLARTAEGVKSKYAYKVVVEDSVDAINDTDSTWYFRGILASAELEVGEADTIVTATYEIGIDGVIYYSPAAVVS
jgi:hypothetical protein